MSLDVVRILYLMFLLSTKLGTTMRLSSKVIGFGILTHTHIVLIPQSISIVIMTLIALNDEVYILSALVFSVSSVFQIIVSPIVARYIQALSLSRQALIWVATRSLSFVLFIAFIWTAPILTITKILLYIILIFIGTVDSTIISYVPLLVKNINNISYAQSSSFANIFGRSALVISPIIGVNYLNGSTYITYVISFAYVIGLLTPFYFASAKKQLELSNNIKYKIDIKNNNKWRVRLQNLSRWPFLYILFLFLFNISLASFSFIIISETDNNYSVSLYTVLYSSFLLSQVAFSIDMIPLSRISSWKNLCILFFVLSLFVLCYGLSDNITFHLIQIILIGFFYSAMFPLLADIVTDQLYGRRYLEYTSTARSVGRVASLSSTWIAGFLLSTGLTPSTVFLLSGTVGIASAAILYFTPLPPDTTAAGHPH